MEYITQRMTTLEVYWFSIADFTLEIWWEKAESKEDQVTLLLEKAKSHECVYCLLNDISSTFWDIL